MVVAAVALLTQFVAIPAAGADVSFGALAARWAPIHYQDTDSTDYDADYLSPIDYDGGWNTLNNWEHQDDDVSDLVGTVYHSVTRTSTHWFIIYAYYHPRDWDDNPFASEHENDLEGVLLTIRRDGSTYGRFEAMVTVAHEDFYSFTPPGSSYGDGREDVDGPAIMQPYGNWLRPTTRQEAKGHGVKAWDGNNFPGGDGIVYYPLAGGRVPSGGNDRNVGYQLVDIFAPAGCGRTATTPRRSSTGASSAATTVTTTPPTPRGDGTTTTTVATCCMACSPLTRPSWCPSTSAAKARSP